MTWFGLRYVPNNASNDGHELEPDLLWLRQLVRVGPRCFKVLSGRLSFSHPGVQNLGRGKI